MYVAGKHRRSRQSWMWVWPALNAATRLAPLAATLLALLEG